MVVHKTSENLIKQVNWRGKTAHLIVDPKRTLNKWLEGYIDCEFLVWGEWRWWTNLSEVSHDNLSSSLCNNSLIWHRLDVMISLDIKIVLSEPLVVKAYWDERQFLGRGALVVFVIFGEDDLNFSIAKDRLEKLTLSELFPILTGIWNSHDKVNFSSRSLAMEKLRSSSPKITNTTKAPLPKNCLSSQ
jgi:hypothetical protein